MKKKICLLLTLVISIFMFSGRVEAANIYVKCNLECTESGYGPQEGADEFVAITGKSGNVGYFAVEPERGGSKYFAWHLEKDYDNGGDRPGCWLQRLYYWTEGACNSSNAYSEKSPIDIVLDGACPKCMHVSPWSWIADAGNWDIADRFYSEELVPLGKGITSKVETIKKTEYVVYKFKDGDGNERIMMEGYLGDDSGNPSAYAFIGPHINAFWWVDGVAEHQLNQLTNFGSDFWKVHELDETRLIFASTDVNGSKSSTAVNVCNGLSVQECREQYDYEVLFDSNDSNGNLKNLVSKWYDENKEKIDSGNGIFTVIDNQKLNNTCNDINSKLSDGKSYKFSDDYDSEKLIEDLEDAYNALLKSFRDGFSFTDYTNPGGTTDVPDSVLTKAYKDIFEVAKLEDIAYGSSADFKVNHQHLQTALQRDVKKILNEFVYGDQKEVPEINIINITDYLNDYTLLYFTTVSYLDSNTLLFGLDTEEAAKVSSLRTKYEDLVKIYDLDIYPAVDCKGILGQDLIDKINSYLDVIKIIIPIILIGFGVLDFTKAIFGGEDDMKKAQNAFFKRICIAVVIFLTPSLVNLLLNLANSVWPIISPNACGIFE